MTTALRDNSTKRTAFSDWLRQSEELDSRTYALSITDVDYCVHQYMRNGSRGEQNIMLVEEKCRMVLPPSSQWDTLHIIDTALKIINGRIIQNPNGQARRIHYYGLHVLMFENTSPTDGAVYWDRQLITVEKLIQLLRFEKMNNR